ncbi:MAG: flagellar basal-body MS-ring/collar protein FliF [Clostridium sp.]|uniref:flagellar basal-body MS-ring/collar protein FliF n=1 Tax=Clostridium sp. TaxID=1506 RepID=UPI002FCB05B9
MNRFLEFFKDKFEKWKAWSKIKKITSVSIGALLIASLIIGVVYATRTEYATLFSNLEVADSNKVVEKLKTDKIPYKIEGNAILVPNEKVDELRMSSLSDGTVSSGTGFELFDQSAIGMTDKEASVKYQRALQGELERSIATFEEVEKAKVLINLPEETVFTKDTEKGSASVTLTLTGSGKLKEEKVKAIIALVTGSTKNIPQENVEVVDSKMNLLSDGLFDENENGTVATSKQYEQEKYFEKSLEKEVMESLESMFGQGKVRVNMNADLDFDSKKVTAITYDKDNVIPISVKEYKETAKDNGNGATTPGVDTNTGVTYPNSNGSNGSSTSERTETITNNEAGTTEEIVVKAPGEVRRLTASVMIDGNLSEAQKASVRNMVAAAVGYDSVNRRDVINVDSMVFDEDAKRAEEAAKKALEQEEAKKELIRNILLIAVGLALVVGSIVALLIWRKKKYQDEDEELLTGGNIDMADGTSPLAPSEYSPVLDENEDEYKMNLEKEIRSYAAKKPEQVVDIIKTWLSEDER